MFDFENPRLPDGTPLKPWDGTDKGNCGYVYVIREEDAFAYFVAPNGCVYSIRKDGGELTLWCGPARLPFHLHRLNQLDIGLVKTTK